MLLNEIINEVGMTKRAVKYYEEKGLLSVDKDNNGYRNYTAQDVETLKKISVYRKLGISIKDIQSLLETGDKSILLRIYQEKVQEKVLKDSELEALKQFIDDGDADKANEALDYQTVENAIESLLPGKEWGDYFKSHFKPFLNVRLKTLEQKQALQNILEYCDETTYIDAGIIPKYAGCVNGVQWFRDRGQWADGSYEPSPGTIIFFDWEGDGVTDHTGIVQKCENGTVYTVEGNSGDTCRTKTYPVGSSVIYGYGIPAY